MKIDPFAVAIMALLATNVVEGKRKEKGGGGLRKWRDQHKNKPHKGGGGGGGGGRKHRQKCSATIAVANRASGTVSVLDAESGGLRATIDLPGNAEPVSCCLGSCLGSCLKIVFLRHSHFLRPSL